MRLNRRLTFSEELGNTITHGVMAAATLVLLPIGSLWGYFHGGYAAATGISIFIMSLLLMFLSSTLYHAMFSYSWWLERYFNCCYTMGNCIIWNII